MLKSPVVLLHTDNPEASANVLLSVHPDLNVHTCNSYESLPDALEQSQAEIIYSVRFAGTLNYPREAIFNTKSVKWLSVGGSGTDHLSPWNPANVVVTNAAGVAASMMAEYIIGCLLSFRLNLRQFHQAQLDQRWLAGSVKPIEGSTVLVLGLGHTGRAVAKKCQALGMKVLGTRANPQATEHVDEVHGIENLNKLLPRADVIVCSVPLLDSTQHLLSTQHFKLMPSNCILIDVSRGRSYRPIGPHKRLAEQAYRRGRT
ncbi:NAD(P)-binding domain-containing protein [Granulosicoccus sp.]|nr:NAD(P)-dependent oxidoreductase [Granulosicoccus sp.]MDB4223247.1 NAD(P)-binding domain-containing protein [Granulosicoccus sp.]